MRDTVPAIRVRHLVKTAHRSGNLIARIGLWAAAVNRSECGGIRQSWPHAQPFIYPIKRTPGAI